MDLRRYRGCGVVIRVHFHPTFADQFARTVADTELLEIAGEVNGLISALGQRGRLIRPIEGESGERD